MPDADPRAAYQTRRDLYRGRRADIDRRLDHLGLARLAVGAVVPIVAALTLGFRVLPLASILLPIVALVGLFAWYGRLKAKRNMLLRAEAFHERGLARLEDAWAGQGDPGARYLDENHLYAADLDLFGPASVFERLCEAHTRGGQDTLAGWLLAPSEPLTIRRRQEAVAELRGRLDLRERLALLGESVPGGLDTASLAAWAARPSELPLRSGARVLDILTIGLALAVLGWIVLGVGPIPFVAVLLAQFGLVTWLARPVSGVLREVERRAHDLLELSGILGSIEDETFIAPYLRDLQQSLRAGGIAPSRQIAHLVTLIDLLNSRRNQFFLPVALLLMWGTRMAFAIDAWRSRCGPAVGRWFGAIADLEALLSLAGYSFENPAEPFPEILDGGTVYEAEAMRHPLLPRGKCVPNDLRLGSEVKLLVVSGSNMSGKSTWLRTVGVNAVLGLAGAPVTATRARLAPLAIGATLRIQDSLQAGKSRFYAEITRIERIVERAKGPLPLLFLLDEILHGTNSHDRGIGAEAIVRALVERGAIGLVTTHDLALTQVAEGLAPRAANVHFADHMIGGEMVFDYRMQPGVVRHSNAIALMRAVGLPV